MPKSGEPKVEELLLQICNIKTSFLISSFVDSRKAGKLLRKMGKTLRNSDDDTSDSFGK